MFDVIIDGVSMNHHGFLAQKRPDEPSPSRKVQKSTVLSSDGDVYRSLPFYEDKEQSIDFNFLVKNPNLWNEKVREFRKLVRDAKELIFSDDQHYYRKVKAVSIGSCSRPARTLGRMSLELTLDPYQYYVPGKEFYREKNIYSFNAHDESYPVYRIQGSGQVTLTVNGYSCKVIVPNEIYLDTKREIAYDGNKGNRNASTNADYKKLVLRPGQNTINISSGVLEVQPNWRDL